MDTRLGDITIGQLLEFLFFASSAIVLIILALYGAFRFAGWIASAVRNNEGPDYREAYKKRSHRASENDP